MCYNFKNTYGCGRDNMVKCKECGYSNTDNTSICAGCGNNISDKPNVLLKDVTANENKYKYKRKANKYKKMVFIEFAFIIIFVVFLIFIFVNNNNKVNELEEQNIKLEQDCEYYKEKYNDINVKYKAILNSENYKVFLEIEDKQVLISSMEQEISNTETEIQMLNAKIAELEGKYEQKLSEPISFSAGQYECGVHFEPGRYRIYGGSSNFFVNNGLDLNIILGNDPSWGQVPEYIYNFKRGDEVESRSPFKMQLITE